MKQSRSASPSRAKRAGGGDAVARPGACEGRGGKKENVRWPVSRVLYLLAQAMTIPLGCVLPHTSRDRPGRRCGKHHVPSLFGLAPGGACRAAPVARTRCALTAPFQPCRGFRPVGGVISVALSLGSPPPAVNRHRLSVEPGLSSTLLANAAVIQPSDAAGYIRDFRRAQNPRSPRHEAASCHRAVRWNPPGSPAAGFRCSPG